MDREKTYAVLGMGRYGKRIADIISKTGATITVADNDPQIIKKYAPKVTMALCADLSEPSAVKDLGLKYVDVAIIDLANELEAAILCVMIAKEKGVDKVIAKAASHRMGKVLEKVGADEIVFPEEESAERMARYLISDDFIEYINIGDNLCVIKLRTLKEWAGKPLNKLELRTKYHANLLAIEVDGNYSADFSPDTVLQADNKLMILTHRQYVFDYI